MCNDNNMGDNNISDNFFAIKTIYNRNIMAIFVVSVMQCKKLWFTDNFSIKKKIQKI